MPVLHRLAANARGRDYVCGDIHGMHGFLLSALDAIHFDKAVDRLICAGDLVDRGPDNLSVVELLEQPWFFSVMGNHERNLVRYARNECLEFDLDPWFLILPQHMRLQIGRAFSELPLAIEILTRSGMAGVVHAEVPEPLCWDEFVATLAEDCGAFQAVWGERVFQSVTKHGHVPVPVAGIERVFHGHRRPRDRVSFVVGNRHWLDTGAYEIFTRRDRPAAWYRPGLTFAEADTGIHHFVAADLSVASRVP